MQIRISNTAAIFQNLIIALKFLLTVVVCEIGKTWFCWCLIWLKNCVGSGNFSNLFLEYTSVTRIKKRYDACDEIEYENIVVYKMRVNKKVVPPLS